MTLDVIESIVNPGNGFSHLLNPGWWRRIKRDDQQDTLSKKNLSNLKGDVLWQVLIETGKQDGSLGAGCRVHMDLYPNIFSVPLS